MRSFLVAALLVHAEAQVPEAVATTTQAATLAAAKDVNETEQQQQPFNLSKFNLTQGMEYIQNKSKGNAPFGKGLEYLQNLSGGEAPFSGGDNFNYSKYTNFGGGDYSNYSQYMKFGGGESSGSYGGYQKYMDKYTGNNSMYKTNMHKYENQYASKFMPSAVRSSEATALAAVPEDVADTTEAATLTTAKGMNETEQTQQAFNLSKVNLTKEQREYIQKVSGGEAPFGRGHNFNYSKYMKFGGGESSGSYGDYQKYVDEYTGNNSMYKTNMHKYENQYASKFMPQDSTGEATALASPAGRRSSAWALLLCAVAGGSIPVAFAAWRRRRHEAGAEEPAPFHLMA